MNFYLTPLNLIVFVSVVVYFIFDYFDARQVQDEREELIKLKAFNIVQKVTLLSLLLLSIVQFFTLSLNAPLVIFILIVASLYSEIVAKIILRRRM